MKTWVHMLALFNFWDMRVALVGLVWSLWVGDVFVYKEGQVVVLFLVVAFCSRAAGVLGTWYLVQDGMNGQEAA